MMDDITEQATWLEPDWYHSAVEWIHGLLNRRTVHVTGSIEPCRVRPWSVVLRIPTDSGDCFFKVTAPYLAREPALVQALSLWRPDCVPELFGVDLKRNWMLMADAGTILRVAILSDCDLTHWHRVLPLYAGLQKDLAPHAGELLSLGAIDRRLTVLPRLYDDLMNDTASLRLGEEGGLSPTEYAFLLGEKDHLVELCGKLSSFRIPESLDHNDFHDGNITIRNGSYTLFDWGDACVTHPFFSMIVVPRYVSDRLGIDETDPRIVMLQEHYLRPWLEYEADENLHRALGLAQCLGTICRALTWRQVITHLPPGYVLQYAEGVSGWPQEFASRLKGGSY